MGIDQRPKETMEKSGYVRTTLVADQRTLVADQVADQAVRVASKLLTKLTPSP